MNNTQSIIKIVGILGIVSAMLVIPASRYILLTGIQHVVGTLASATGGELATSHTEDLTSRNTSLEAEVASLLYLKQENEILRSALETQNSTNFTPIMTPVISFDNNFLRDTALVQGGSDQGIQIGQAAIYLGHLIGQVIEVYSDTSRVQIIFDSQSTIGVKLGNEVNSEGVLKSTYGTNLLVDLVPKVEQVSEGDPIYTSGIGGLPPGLVIGKVKEVSEGDLFHRIEVDYPVNPYRIHTMFILKP